MSNTSNTIPAKAAKTIFQTASLSFEEVGVSGRSTVNTFEMKRKEWLKLNYTYIII